MSSVARGRLARSDLIWIAAVVVVAALLRFHDYPLAPPLRDNHDELTWAWSGLTLITRHVPYAWTNFHSYTDYFLLPANHTVYKMVHPYFDDPPLFSLLVGGFAWLRGARDFVDVTPEMIRPVPILLSTVTVAQVYLLARRLGHAWPARLGALALAVAPGAVLFGRQAEAEALIAPLFLAALLLTLRITAGGGRNWAIAGLLACCYLAPLAKLSGLAVALTCGGLLLMAGRWRLALATVAAALAAVGTFALYGAAYDWRLFLAVVQEQAERRHGVMAGYEFLAAPAGLGRAIRDGWWVLGWLGVAFLLARARDRAERFVAWPALAYAATIFLLTDEQVGTYYGWYRISAYPLLYLATGFLTWRAIRDASPPALIAFLILAGATSTTVLLGTPWVPSALLVAAIGAVVLLPALLAQREDAHPRLTRAARSIAALAVAGVLLAAAAESFDLANVYALI